MTALWERSLEMKDQLVEWRRWLHKRPELSFQEKGTARYIAEVCLANGWEVREGIAGTGIIAMVHGAKKGRTIALRADMDALPIQEVEGRSHASEVPGVMHACGHDVHMAMVLGAGRSLNDQREKLHGSVMLLFQPGEEKLPGGASLVMKDDAFSTSLPKAIVAQHVTPEIPVGKVGFREGPFMASADELHFLIRGKGGHAAMPHLLVDPVLITAHVITALQQVVSRRMRPGMSTVLSFGKVIADGATNVIPDVVRLEGTLRAFDESWREELHALIPQMISGIVTSMGGSVECEVRKGYPVLINDPALTRSVRAAAEEVIGSANVLDLDQRMGAEDFAYYGQHMPACLYRLGTGNAQKGITSGLHSSSFDVDEDAMIIGAAVMAAWVAKELAE